MIEHGGRGAYDCNDRRYRLGFGIGTLVEAFATEVAPDAVLAGFVAQLAQETGEGTYLAARRGVELVLLTSSLGWHAVQPATSVTGILPDPHARASGKVAFAFTPSATRTEFIRAHQPLRACTASTITDPDELEREFEQIRGQGYALSREEVAEGVSTMAAPIDEGVSPYVFALSAPKARFETNFDEYLKSLLRIATDASMTHVKENAGLDTPELPQEGDR